MTTLPDPPLTSSILAYNPFFPNGIVSDAWGAYFTALSSIIIAGPVESFNGRTGAVVPASGDYTASLIPFTPAGTSAVLTNLDADTKARFSNFEGFGAKGDGVTDDTAAIQAGLNSGRTAFMLKPGSTYIINGGLTCSTAGMTLFCYGATVKLKNSAGNLGMLTLSGAGSGVYGGTWDGNSANGNATGSVYNSFGVCVDNSNMVVRDTIHINQFGIGIKGTYKARYTTIEKNSVTGTTGYGIYIDGATIANGQTSNQTHNRAIGNYIDMTNGGTTGQGILFTGIMAEYYQEYFEVSGNTVIGPQGALGAQAICLAVRGNRGIFANNRTKYGSMGISEGGSDTTYTGNIITDLQGTVANGIEPSGANCTITGNTIRNALIGIMADTASNYDSMSITGNRISATTNAIKLIAGVSFTGKNCVISGNTMAVSTGQIIYTTGDISNLTISGNTLTGPGSGTSGSRGVFINTPATAVQVLISGNKVTGVERAFSIYATSAITYTDLVAIGNSFTDVGSISSGWAAEGSAVIGTRVVNAYDADPAGSGKRWIDQSTNVFELFGNSYNNPNGNLTAGVGSMYYPTIGNKGAWRKESGTGNTGWVNLNPIASTATTPSLNIPVGVADTSAVAGDLWNDATGTLNFKGGFVASSFATVPQGTTSGTVDYTGATDSTANLQAILDAAAQGTVVWLKPGTPKFNVILRKNGVSLMGSGMAQFTGSTTSYWQPFDVTKPVVTIGDDLAVYNGCSVVNALLYTPSGTGQKGLVFAGGAQKCYAKNIMSLGFTKSCIEFRNDDVNPCTFNAADTIFASTNVVGANGISYIDNHVAGTGYTTACEVSNFSTTAPNGYPVYCESAQTNSLSNGYIQTSYSGHGIYFKKTSSEVYYPRLNFSNVDVDNVSGYGTVSTVLDIAGTYPSNYRSATDVANLSPIMGELNTAANSYWAAGHTTLSANFTVAATTITLTSVAGLEAGMHIMIPGAGASGRNYFDQIVSIAGSVVTLSQHNSSTQVNSGGDVSWGDIVNAVDTRGVLSSFSNGAIVVGATNKDGVTGDGAGLIYQSNGAGQGYWSSGDFISEWKDKQLRFLGSVSSPSVTAISRVGTTVTVTTSSAHKMGVGDPFALSGIVDADGFNSTTQWQPTVASVGSSTTFTYTSLVSGSTTPANQNPTLVPYRGMHFNRGRLEFDNGTGSGIGFKVAAGTMGAAIFTDNINPTLNIWTPDTTNGTYDFRWGSSISTGKAMRIGNNSVGDRAYLTGNGAWWLLNAAAPATDSGGSFIYAATVDNRMHIKDASGNDGAILTTTDQVGTFTTAAPTGTTSATAVMMGLGGSATITPKNSTRLLIMATFQASNSTLNDGITCDLRFGTGTAPTNGAAVTGTLVGIAQTRTSLVAADRGGMVLCGIATGLTLGTAYWLDVSALAVTGGTASITGVTVTAHEI